jgi:putative spermidine/putrescine transport system ATP-binding protein
VVMKDGLVQQTGTQEDLYERPATPFVAGFIGRSTMMTGALHDGGAMTVDGAAIRLAGRYAGAGPCTLALRPERLAIGAGAGPGQVEGVVELASYLGAVREHVVRIGPEQRIVVRDPTGGAGRLHDAGETVVLSWDAGAERLFDAASSPLAHAPR